MRLRLVSLLTLSLACSGSKASVPTEVADRAAYVNPFIGSGGQGFGYGSNSPAAMAPSGLVKVGPDTSGPYGLASFLHFSGYWYGDDTVRGFSHLRLQGAGSTDYGLLSVMPVLGFDAAWLQNGDGVASPFQKSSETATPGFYAVTLERFGVRAELTATTRTAHHRYTFPRTTAAGQLTLDFGHVMDGGEVKDSQVTLSPAERRIEGQLKAVGRMSGGFGGYTLYFSARTRAAWTQSAAWQDTTFTPGATQVAGKKTGLVLTFDTTSGAPLELQAGLSFVSAAQARKNLDAEAPAFDFDAVRAATRAEWERRLAAVTVSGGSEAERTRFYSALYAAYLMPTVHSDVDGSYRGFDGQVHTATGFRFLSELSMWDTYRTTHPLYATLAPDVARDAVRSLVEMAKQSGRFPKWPIANGDSGSMIGAPAESVVADAYLRGVTDFDARGAYAILRAAALDPTAPAAGRGGRDNFEVYSQLGYVTAESGGSVSRTGEYATNDFALGNLAAALGETADAAALRARSLGYRKLFDPSTGFMRAKTREGAFKEPFDPLSWSDEYVEANAWQSTWLGLHDLDGFMALFGGPAAMVDKLSLFFELAKSEYDGRSPTDLLAMLLPPSYYWQGNEPDIHAAYLFAEAGRPDLTGRWVDWIRTTHYAATPEGLAGNDDGGALSSWYVFSALGFYPIAGSDRFIVGTPLFPKARLAVPGGEFVIEAKNRVAGAIYVQSVTLNGAPLTGVELRQTDLRAGGSLVFTMGTTPGSWGRR